MALTFTPDLLSYSSLSRNVADLKARADVTRTESVTGRYEDITAQTNGDIGGAHLTKKALDDVIAYKENLTFSQNQAAAVQTVLDSVNTDGARIATEALAAAERDDNAALRTSVEEARAAVKSVFAALNTSVGGRALFSGDVAERAPLASPDQFIADIEAIMASAVDAADAEAMLDTYFNDPTGGFATSIYQGGAGEAPGVEIAPGVRLDVSAKADDQSVRDLLRGLASIAAYDSAGFADRDTLIEDGGTLVLEAGVDLTDLRARIGVGESRIEAAITRYTQEEAALTTLFNQKTARDPYEAASELRLLETQLEASYLLTSRLSQLTIANYLR